MDAQPNGRLGARHLSQIKEETDSREQSSCFLPPIVQRQQTTGGGEPGEAGVDEVVRQEVRQEVRGLSDPASPASPPLYEHQRTDDNESLLEELGRIEAELQVTLRLDVERQREDEFLRQQENKLLWQNLSHLRLSQRVAKPWVSSYFREFPLHIYCLPVQASAPRHRGRRGGVSKRK